MSIAVVFTPPSMSAAQYDEVISRLKSAGAGNPQGRTLHVCHGSGDQLRVFDIWDSQQSFDAFGKTLMPILSEVGLNPGSPAISEIHNTIEA